ncbi:MAG: hypothetical protein ACKOOI_18010, partial [Pirellula sp.]
QMPPEGARLSDDQIANIRVWIQQGATGPDESNLLEKPLPWSFRPIEDPWLPTSDTPTQYHSHNPIDQWIQTRILAI